MTLTRAALVDLLNIRRDNDVYIVVPREDGDELRLAIHAVRYDHLTDTIEVVTETDMNLLAEEARAAEEAETLCS